MRLRRKKSVEAELAAAAASGEKRVLYETRRPRAAAPSRGPSAAYPWEWTRDKLPSGRKGQACRKVQPLPGTKRPNGMATIEFTDGKRFVVDPQGLRKRT